MILGGLLFVVFFGYVSNIKGFNVFVDVICKYVVVGIEFYVIGIVSGDLDQQNFDYFKCCFVFGGFDCVVYFVVLQVVYYVCLLLFSVEYDFIVSGLVIDVICGFKLLLVLCICLFDVIVVKYGLIGCIVDILVVLSDVFDNLFVLDLVQYCSWVDNLCCIWLVCYFVVFVCDYVEILC